MRSLLIITVLLSVNGAEQQLSDSLYDFSTQHQLQRYRMRVDILHNQLLTYRFLTAAEPDVLLPAKKRGLIGAEAEQELEVEKTLFIKLRDMLIKCKKSKLNVTTTTTASKTGPRPTTQSATMKMTTTSTPNPTTTVSSTTATTTTPTTTPSTTTPSTTTSSTTTSTTTPTTKLSTATPVSLLAACQSAINLPDSWRMDHSGSSITPIAGERNDGTDRMIKQGRPWFRFSGSAGNMMLNHTVPENSCGTHLVLWSNNTMPSAVGVETPIKVYGDYNDPTSDGNRKRGYTLSASVMRCSHYSGDFVYRYTEAKEDTRGCCWGFCGMIA